ncbi:hypothetical protein ACFL6Y_04395 [Elusimicrobiota bacterium]
MFQNECEGMFESDYAIFPSAHLSDGVIGDQRWAKAHSKLMHGPDYIIVNEQVRGMKNNDSNSVPHIAITTGASDPGGILLELIKWLNESNITVNVKILFGFDFCFRAELESMCSLVKPTIEVKEFNYKDLLSATLAVSTFGVTPYELIYANIPVITLGHIQKNSIGGETLQRRYGCNYHLGLFQGVDREQFISTVELLWNSSETLLAMKKKQKNLIDGKGLERVGKLIANCCMRQRAPQGCGCANRTAMGVKQ